MKQLFSFILCLLGIANLQAQTDPMITSWWFNTTNQTYTGVNGTILVNVEAVYYSTSLVYVKSTGVPSYYADGGSLFSAKDMTNVFKLPRTQTVATTATRTYLRDEGAIGVLKDGSVILSPGDGKTYNSAGVWHQLAYKFESGDFDTTKGHSTPSGQYHHHVAVNQSTLNSLTDSSTHSPLIGYAFDGYPVYGPYGYTNVNGTGAIKRMTSGWAVRNITTRTTLPDGSTASSAGPTIALQALGKYYEDYAYTAGSGDLDQYNGRFCITPEYPSGTYCYFTTLDSSLNPFFPYFIGDYFYGVVQSGNMGPTGGNNTVPGTATLYNSTLSADDNIFEKVQVKTFPNPVVDVLKIENTSADEYKINIYNMTGAVIYKSELKGQNATIDMSQYASGNYVIEFINKNSGDGYMKRVVKN
jgi:YHYH protein/Secretion system C-terminal sorting domain